MNSIDITKALIAEMLTAGVRFDNTPDDIRRAWTYSRVGKTFAVNRKTRNDAYNRAIENASENAEGRALGLI